MSTSKITTENEFQHFKNRETARDAKSYAATKAELTAALAREEKALIEKNELLLRQNMLAEEFEHRLVNSLQLIVSLLSMQSRAAPTTEAAVQLTIAAGRVASIGRVHRRLHLLDRQKSVEFKQYLQDLCDDLSNLLLQKDAGRTVAVTGADIILPSSLGIPLGFIVNELITNCVKYTTGNITVQIESSVTGHLLSVSDDGPGLPAAFDPARSKGLGMKIIQALVKQIGGTLQFGPGEGGHGTRFTVKFAS